MPCPECNARDKPKMPAGFEIDADGDDDGKRQCLPSQAGRTLQRSCREP
jgi:hypothetical protein